MGPSDSFGGANRLPTVEENIKLKKEENIKLKKEENIKLKKTDSPKKISQN
jgi:hypothetical protein